jgi:PIN domain nuclease of toxin-antitoxin system
MGSLYLDTHAVLWLYQDAGTRLTPLGREAVDAAESLLISPMVELEITYLQEIGRINTRAAEILDTLRRDMDLETCKLPFATVVGEALLQVWTRDPFDRIIVAQAAARSSPLLTADAAMRDHYSAALW